MISNIHAELYVGVVDVFLRISFDKLSQHCSLQNRDLQVNLYNIVIFYFTYTGSYI